MSSGWDPRRSWSSDERVEIARELPASVVAVVAIALRALWLTMRQSSRVIRHDRARIGDRAPPRTALSVSTSSSRLKRRRIVVISQSVVPSA